MRSLNGHGATPRTSLCNAYCYAFCMAQLVTRIDDDLVSLIDAAIADGVASSRSELVRLGLERILDEVRRTKTGAAIVAGYQRVPETDDELSDLSAATRALIEEEPW